MNQFEKPIVMYDEISDERHIAFAPNENGLNIQLTEHLLLKVCTKTKQAIGLTIFDYSTFRDESGYGFTMYPLTELLRAPEKSMIMALNSMKDSSVCDFLTFRFPSRYYWPEDASKVSPELLKRIVSEMLVGIGKPQQQELQKAG